MNLNASSTNAHSNHSNAHVNLNQKFSKENLFRQNSISVENVPNFDQNSQNFGRNLNWNFYENSNQNFSYDNFLRQNLNQPENVPNFSQNLAQNNFSHLNSNYAGNFHSNANQYVSMYTPSRRDHKMYKWNVNFTGENTKYDAIDFIRKVGKVNAMAQFRGVTDCELFESAIEFFSGQALKWYYAQCNQLKSWSDLSDKLISDFMPAR